MTDHRGQILFKSAGFTGVDIRHIAVRVYPYSEIKDGKLVEAHRVYIGSKKGDIRASTPTDYIFVCASKDWVFHEFELANEKWPGLALFPKSGDYSLKFGDAQQKSVLLHDNCKVFYTHRYQIILRNTKTGELASCDPDAGSDDDEGEV
ncbi:MAG: hypothetical protein COA84_01460 [Robiginitomaculum sp.]|nr:MAG: hypothetical protein COA84_01460 [Robiginitomaculum sp.]